MEANQSGNTSTSIRQNEIPVATAVLAEPEIPVASLVPLAVPSGDSGNVIRVK